MGNVLITIKLMPKSPESDLNEIKEEAEKSLKKAGVTKISFEEKPIAFGLKAIMIITESPESLGSEIIESSLSKIPHVSSVTIEDYRRSFG